MIAVIGIGYWGSKIVSLLKSKNLEVETIDIDNDITKIKSKNVIISTPARTHKDITKTMLELGKNVLVEKPSFINMKECEEIETVLKKTKGKFMCGHLFLNSPKLNHIKKTVKNISHIESRRLNWGRVQEDINPIIHLAPHDISILDYLMDDIPIFIQKTPYHISKKSQPDYVTIDLTYMNGKTAQLQVGWYYNEKIRQVKIFADDTIIDFEGEDNLLDISLSKFISYCHDDIEPITNFEHAKRVTHVLDMIQNENAIHRTK